MKPTPPLSWENFRSSIVVRAEQRVHRIAESPRIEVFGDGVLGRVGLWLEVPDGTVIPQEIEKLAFISSLTLARGSRTLLELSVSKPGLFMQFYYFAVAVSERVREGRMHALEAVLLELRAFAELMEEKTLLGVERQLGLLGELVVLERLIGKLGPSAVEAWVGPKHEPHDFRVQKSEFEVKTTIRSQRIHTIHGTEQLTPSQGCALYILSILLAPAGMADGITLAEKADALRASLATAPLFSQQLQAALQESGFRDADRANYSRRYVLRRPLAAIHVDGRLPAITRASIQAKFGPQAARLEAVEYDLNIEGLEVEDENEAFSAAFPA
jgi:hypothetical protein